MTPAAWAAMYSHPEVSSIGTYHTDFTYCRTLSIIGIVNLRLVTTFCTVRRHGMTVVITVLRKKLLSQSTTLKGGMVLQVEVLRLQRVSQPIHWTPAT